MQRHGRSSKPRYFLHFSVCYHATARECGLTADECVLLARNSLEATFAAPEDKAALVARLRAYCEAFSA